VDYFDRIPFMNYADELTYHEFELMNNLYWYLLSSGDKFAFKSEHMNAPCAEPDTTKAFFGDHESVTNDPFKQKILEGLKLSLANAGVAYIEQLNNEALYGGKTRIPFRPDLLFGYNGVQVALFFVNTTKHGKTGNLNNGNLNIKFTTLENLNKSMKCIAVPIESFIEYDLEKLKINVKDFDVE